MVLPVDDLAFQIVSVVGLSLPIFLFAVDAFGTDGRSGDDDSSEGEDDDSDSSERDYSTGLVSWAMGLLIGAALFSLIALLIPPKGQRDPSDPLSSFLVNTAMGAKNALFPNYTFPELVRWVKNIFVDISTVLLAVGYLGLWWSICDMLDIDTPIITTPSKKLLQYFAGGATLGVIFLNLLL